VLYIVPPKATRRRGEKPGIAYLLLISPPIETQLAPVTELHPISEEMNTDVVDTTVQVGSNATPSTTSTSANVPAVDYSRDIAKRRLLLQNALESLQVASTKIMMQSNDTMMIVEESLNTKGWKQQPFSSKSPVDRMAGSIFESDDYEQFLEATVRREQQRKARPKPVPGGGLIGTTTLSSGTNGAATSVGADSKPVAALVLHLQKKQEEENQRKLAKRKGRDATKSKASIVVTVQPKVILSNVIAGGEQVGKMKNKKRGSRRVKNKNVTAQNGKKTDEIAAKKSNVG
jgi:hypothetical protein